MGEFRFKEFAISDHRCGMKLSTDAVLLGAWADLSGAATIADFGAGCGILSLMAAQRCPDARIMAIEIDAGAYADMEANVAASPWAPRIETICADVLTLELPKELRYPLAIISNPPFFSEKLKSPKESRALARHGDDFTVETLIPTGSGWMKGMPGCSLTFIAPSSRDGEIEFLLALNRLYPRRILAVRSVATRAPMRTLWEAAPQSGRCMKSEICLREADGTPSAQFATLTSQFYLDK